MAETTKSIGSKNAAISGRSVDDWTNEYANHRPRYVQFAAKIESLFRDMLNGSLEVHLLESRAKDVHSFREKLLRPGKNYAAPLSEITDLAGVRIIAYYQKDVDAICSLVESEFDVDKENSTGKESEPSSFGYKSSHYIVKLPSMRAKLREWAQFSDLQVEIQVRTVLQHAWAAISHKLQYKREDDVPVVLRRKLFRLSALFELADDEFVSIRNETDALARTIGLGFSEGNADFAIDFVSLKEFMALSPDVARLASIASEVGFSMDSDEDADGAISSIVRMTKHLKINMISELDRILKNSIEWAHMYLHAQFSKSVGGRRWEVSPEFVCLLILIGAFSEKIEIADLLDEGWDSGIAARVSRISRTWNRSNKQA